MGRKRKHTTSKRKLSPEGGAKGGDEDHPNSTRKQFKPEQQCPLYDGEGEESPVAGMRQQDINIENAMLGKGADSAWNDPFAIIPEVVVHEYLERCIASPKDKFNLSRAFPGAAELLKPWKATWIFNGLFPIQAFQDVFTKSEILNFRLVCKSWRASIDNFYEGIYEAEPNYRNYMSILNTTQASHYKTDFRIVQKRSQLNKFFLPNLRAGTNTPRLLSLIEHHDGNEDEDKDDDEDKDKDEDEDDKDYEIPRVRYPYFNPFISKMIRTWFKKNGRISLFPDAVQTILNKFGKGLRSMELRNVGNMTAWHLLTKLKNFLHQVPLLTALDYDVTATIRDPEDLEDIEPFPAMPKLRTLSLSVPLPAIYSSFTMYFDQLVTLDVCRCAEFMSWYNPKRDSTFPNLRKLSIQIIGVRALGKLRLMRSPLKELGILNQMTSQDYYNICPLVYFHAAENFSPTLSGFKVEEQYRCSGGTKTLSSFGLPQPREIRMPQIKCVSVTIMDCGYGSVDHLLKLSPSPEYLENNLGKCSNCHNGEPKIGRRSRLEIHGYLGPNMYSSNVWRLLPALNEIHVWKGDDLVGNQTAPEHYTRAKYEYGLCRPSE